MNAETHIGHPKLFLKLSNVNVDTVEQFFINPLNAELNPSVICLHY
jgi:hypothetical protein